MGPGGRRAAQEKPTLKVELKQLENWKRSLDVEVPVEDVQRHFDRLVQEHRRRMALPGFRKGKVPEHLVRQSLAGSIDEEFLNQVVPEAYEQALREAHVEPASQAQIENLQYRPGEPLRFTALFEVRPELEPRDYRGLKLLQEVAEVGDADVERVLADLRQQAAEFPVVEAEAGPESVVVVDYQAHDESGQPLPDGRRHGYALELGAAGLLPEFRDGLLGARAGQGRTLLVSYPADFRNPKLAGKKVRYDMTVKEVREKKLPELDDNLARERFGYRDVEDLRSHIRLRLEGEERLAARERLESAVVDEVLRRNDFSPPESMVESLLERLVERAKERDAGVPEEELARLRRDYHPAAERSVKRQLLWEAIARAEQLKLSTEEVDAEVRRMVEAGAAGAGRGQRGPDEATLRQPRNLERIQDALLDRKVFEFLIQASEVETRPRPRPEPDAAP